MASVIVVVVEPWCKRGGAFVVGREHLSIGPFGGEGAVEAFYLAVGLRTVGAGPSVLQVWAQGSGRRS